MTPSERRSWHALDVLAACVLMLVILGLFLPMRSLRAVDP
jgi:hypothetical protein